MTGAGPEDALTPEKVRAASSDDELFGLLGLEIQRLLPGGREPTDEFVEQLRGLPPGLRAMAATYELDVSLHLDDLGWHFGNWRHAGLAAETAAGLRELGAERLAAIFSQALEIAQGFWNELGRADWTDWYRDSALDRALQPLNDEAWAIHAGQKLGIFSYWLAHARAHPERLFLQR